MENHFDATFIQGALSHGDRRVSNDNSLSKYYLNPHYTKLTLRNLLTSISKGEPCVKHIDTTVRGKNQREKIRKQLIGAGLLTEVGTAKGCFDLERFLNRLFTLTIESQAYLMDLFSDIFKHFVEKQTSGYVNSAVKGKLSQ